MRDEIFYALSNAERVCWLIASAWYMKMGEHFDAAYGSWSKVEGARSILNKWQLSLLKKWKCGREADEIMKTPENMAPEILRLNQVLSKKTNMKTDEEQFKRILEMGY